MNRDERGRFLPGHKIKSPGRPSLAAELPVAEGIRAAGSAEDIALVLEKMRALALRGNVKAATLYLAYVAGKPVETTLEERIAAIEQRLAAPADDIGSLAWLRPAR